MDNLKWRSLNQRLEDLSDLNLESGVLIRSLSQLVLELASELTCTKNTSSRIHSQETYLMNRNEELE